MEQKNEVICMGLCGVDVSVQGLDSARFFHQESTPALRTRLCAGGDAVNQSMTLARLGHRPALMASVGEDDAGRCLRACLAEAGVDISALKTCPDCDTSVGVLVVGENDRRHAVPSTDRSSNRRFDLDNVDFAAFEGARVVSFASLFCFPRMDDGKLTEIFRRARAAGALTCADTKLTAAGSFGDFPQAMTCLDYLFVNQDEAAGYSGREDPEEIADYFLGLGIRHVLIKLGKQGCFIRSGTEAYRLSSFPVETVDTVGAGDNFAAGFISALLRGCSFRDCAVFATATAALTVASLGSSTGVRSMEQVRSFLAARPPL